MKNEFARAMRSRKPVSLSAIGDVARIGDASRLGSDGSSDHGSPRCVNQIVATGSQRRKSARVQLNAGTQQAAAKLSTVIFRNSDEI